MSLANDDLIHSLRNQCGLSKQTSKALVETIFELSKKTLESGDSILISGFGKFSAKKKALRRGRNPATGEDLILETRRVVAFKCSKVLREKINGKGYYLDLAPF
jgi:integration host factor subunit alpha